MRNGLQLPLGIAFTLAIAGCSLLVSFDDVPDAGSGLNVDETDSGFNSSSGESSTSSSSSSGSTTSSSSSSSSTGGTTPDAGTTFPPACDTTINLAAINCNGNTQAVCGGAVTASVTIKPDDLVTCDGDGNPTCVQHCTMGCADMPVADDLPSQCADCTDGNKDRWYCGKDTHWVSGDSDIAYHCSGGRYVADSTAQCGKNACHTDCTRTSPPPLIGSCCQ